MPEPAKTPLTWDKVGERFYETGTDRGVLYLQDSQGTYPNGVAWSGLSGITNKPSGAEPNPIYADNIKYVNIISTEDFGGTIEAYTYPDEWTECDGSKAIKPGITASQQERKTFGLSYRTMIGNDTDGQDHGFKIHLVYGATAATSERAYKTINDNPEAITMSWEFSTIPVPIKGLEASTKPTAHLEVDSRKFKPETIKKLTDVIWGSSSGAARLPMPDEVMTLLTEV